MSTVSFEFVLSFPGGSCGIGSSDSEARDISVMPSPDGTKAAILNQDISFYIPLITVSIVSLVDGTQCPTVSSTHYGGIIGGTNPNDVWEEAIGQFVWRPDSSAIVYPVLHHASDEHANQRALDRLDAVSGASPNESSRRSTSCWCPPAGRSPTASW